MVESSRTYQAHEAPVQIRDQAVWQSPDPKFCIDGNAFLVDSSITDVKSNEILHLNAVRNCQMVKVAGGFEDGGDLVFVNTHMNHKLAPEDDYVRGLQAEQILFWIKSKTRESDRVFLMGDFNAEPDSPAYRLITEAGFKSSYKEIHGAEPEATFHHGLIAEFRDTDPPGTFDYIWIRGTVTPTSATLTGNQCHPNDSTIYPSDHFGLFCDYQL